MDKIKGSLEDPVTLDVIHFELDIWRHPSERLDGADWDSIMYNTHCRLDRA